MRAVDYDTADHGAALGRGLAFTLVAGAIVLCLWPGPLMARLDPLHRVADRAQAIVAAAASPDMRWLPTTSLVPALHGQLR